MNLLLTAANWDLTSAAYAGGIYYVDINGGYFAGPNGLVDWAPGVPPDPGSTVAASVNWTIDFPPDAGNIWFLVLDNGVVVHAEQLYSDAAPGVLSGSFSFNVGVLTNPSMTTSSIATDTDPPINSYDALGFMEVIPSADAVVSTLEFTPQVDVEDPPTDICYPPVCSCTLPAC